MLTLSVFAIILMLGLGVLYFKTVQDIEQDDINEAMARAQRFKNKRASNQWAGA